MAEDKAEKIVKEVAASMKGATWQEIARAAETRIREETGRGIGVSGVMNNYGHIILGTSSGSSSSSTSTSSSSSSSKSSTGATSSSSSRTSAGTSSSSNISTTNSSSKSGTSSNSNSSSTSSSQTNTKVAEVENATLNYKVVVEKTSDGKYRTVIYGEGGAKELSVRQSLEDAQADAQRYATKPQSAFKDVSEYFNIQHRDAFFVAPEAIAKEFKLDPKKETIQAIEETQNKIQWAYTLADIDTRKKEEELKKQAEYLEKTLNARAQDLAKGAVSLDYVYREAAAEYSKEKATKTGEIVVFSPETIQQNFGDQVEKYVSELRGTLEKQSGQEGFPQSNLAMDSLSNFSTLVSQQSAQEKLNRESAQQEIQDGTSYNVFKAWDNPQEEWYKLTAKTEDFFIQASLKTKNEMARGAIGFVGGVATTLSSVVDFLGQVSGVYGIMNNWFSKDSKNKTYEWGTLSTSEKIKIILTSPWVDYTKDEGSTKPITEYFLLQFPKDIRENPLGTLGMLGSSVISGLFSPFEKLKDRDPYLVGSGLGDLAGNFVGPLLTEKAITSTQKIARNIGVTISVPKSAPADKIFDPDVLAGKKTFPTASNPDIALETFKAARTQSGKLAAVHATGQDLPSKIIVKPGPAAAKNLEDAGLYVAPYGHGSPYFLKIEEKVKYSLNPLDFFDMFKKKAPTAVVVQADDIARPPGHLLKTKGFEDLNKWYSLVNKPAGDDVARSFIIKPEVSASPKPSVIYQTKRSIIGQTSEMEAIVPVNTLLVEDISKRIRTNVKGWEVPVKTYIPVPYTTLQSTSTPISLTSSKTYTPSALDSVIYIERKVPVVPVSLLRGRSEHDMPLNVSESEIKESKHIGGSISLFDQSYLPTQKEGMSISRPSLGERGATSVPSFKSQYFLSSTTRPSDIFSFASFEKIQSTPSESGKRQSSRTTEGLSQRPFLGRDGIVSEEGPIRPITTRDPRLRSKDIVPDTTYPSYDPSVRSSGGSISRAIVPNPKQVLKKDVPIAVSKKEKQNFLTIKKGGLREKANLYLVPKAELFFLQKEDVLAGTNFQKIGKHPLHTQKKQWVQQFNSKFVGPTRSMLLSQKKNKKGARL